MQSELNRAFAETMRKHRVVPVLTVDEPAIAIDLAKALAAGGLPLIEITLRTPAALEVVLELATLPDLIVGAGTVLTPEQGRRAIDAGAEFIVSPGTTPALVDAAVDWPVPYLPGVATAGEAMTLAARGYRALKFFPAETSGGAAALKALSAPLADLVFCPTGGIDAAKARVYLTLPNVVAVGGSWVAPDKLVQARDWAAITALARDASMIGTAETPAPAPIVATTAPAEEAASSEATDSLVRRLQQLLKARDWGAIAVLAREALNLGASGQATPAAAAVALTPDGEAEPLSRRLHKLNGPIEEFANQAAHYAELLDHPDFRAAQSLLTDASVLLSTVIDYAIGSKWTLACVALVALRQRPDRSDGLARIATRFGDGTVWQMQFARRLLVEGGVDMLDIALLGARDWWAENSGIVDVFTDWFNDLADDAPRRLGPRLAEAPASTKASVKALLSRVPHPAAEEMASEIESAPSSDTSNASQPRVLDSVGRFWRENTDRLAIVEPPAWSGDLADAAAILERSPPRSILLSGEPLVGKSSFLRLLAARIAPKGWSVFEASGADLQAGQLYIGQLEGRLRQLLDEIAQAGRVVWYVPDLLQLALSGTHQGQSASMLDQILPAIAEGRLVVFSEATPTAATRLLQLRPRLRRALEVIRLEALDTDDSRRLAEDVAVALTKSTGVEIAPGAAAIAVEAAEHYLGKEGLPGAALSILRMTATRAETGARRTVGKGDVLDTLSQISGLPLSILDGSETLDLASLRTFFSERVIGQPEAIESIVQRIAMLKSGLIDPLKPIGVFLFAGPTGTGKTELAKAIADYLFASSERMIRLDMSEFQQPESLVKIIGGGNLPPDAETLVSRIRKQPFSLVLLDEFEKSAPPVWDLFLQVFDEGRLTDAAGQSADFRHSLIILTTNLGATRHQSMGLGFAPSRSAFADDQVLAAIGQTFRPEFQNRLDKVIVFQPLTRTLMRSILKKELDRLFERRGLKDRDWAIEWEASALEFLLEKGFTPEMGARPLKRAIDQYVVAPLAQTIVERRFPEGDQFLFMRSDGSAIQAEFVDPDGEPSAPLEPPKVRAARPPSLSEIVLAPTGSEIEKSTLAALADHITTRIAAPEWDASKAAIVTAMSAPDFWSRPDRFDDLIRYALMDRLAMANDTAAALRTRLERRHAGVEHGARELIGRLALQLHLVREGLADLDARAPVEVAVAVLPAFEANASEPQAAAGWCRRILDMYRGWARRRHMQLSEISGLGNGLDTVLVIGGFGAYRRMCREVGLHVRETGDSNAARAAARVLVVPMPAGDMPKSRLRTILGDGFTSLPHATSVVRRYRVAPSPLVRNADGSWRSGKLDAVLAGDFDLLSEIDT